ncbi:SsgA family sporulation/cell division regulator [Streptomyces sp. NBC_01387]|uniref:SsgA family sporulation/cell division regulator n=1 Tax=unclassified Streptomyces TaxID=2593676 RepID=UPI002023DA42|nr:MULTISPECIES: SsgA family sporulation/cell division regulator [unclassified Streptomyces]MCX4550410.1 SsgA family sporulation/cell division regulator [Streptomyces sp. NBC_01500]WSC21865.1 SsgA family sporulation/cell division regulator [Streptomyces sp. NBC_01766]WSV55820.1 SsgA family sporulation/cell division regulator [Streptomyces sp. NBC_01014]
MSPALDVPVRGHVVTDVPGEWTVVHVALRYDAEAAPGIVRFFFPGGTEWVFARELLEAGLRSPQRSGDIGIWPCGRAQVVVEFHSADGVAVVQFDNTPLMRFLRGTYAEAPRAVRHEEPLRPERPARPSVRR